MSTRRAGKGLSTLQFGARQGQALGSAAQRSPVFIYSSAVNMPARGRGNPASLLLDQQRSPEPPCISSINVNLMAWRDASMAYLI